MLVYIVLTFHPARLAVRRYCRSAVKASITGHKSGACGCNTHRSDDWYYTCTKHDLGQSTGLRYAVRRTVLNCPLRPLITSFFKLKQH